MPAAVIAKIERSVILDKSKEIMSEENLEMLKKVVEMTYGNEEEIKVRAEGKEKK